MNCNVVMADLAIIRDLVHSGQTAPFIEYLIAQLAQTPSVRIQDSLRLLSPELVYLVGEYVCGHWTRLIPSTQAGVVCNLMGAYGSSGAAANLLWDMLLWAHPELLEVADYQVYASDLAIENAFEPRIRQPQMMDYDWHQFDETTDVEGVEGVDDGDSAGCSDADEVDYM